MRNKLPRKPWPVEKGIVNLDDWWNAGSHWVAYSKNGNRVAYFNSSGNLYPPPELT